MRMKKEINEQEDFFSRCSDLLKSCDRSGQKILDYAKAGDLERCDYESQNRERIIKIITQECLEIRKKNFPNKKWEDDFQAFVQKNIQRDAEILSVLRAERGGLQNAIASVYKIRKNIQGYSPYSV